MEIQKISFSKPYFSESEILNVTEVVKSLWVANGPRLMEFENSFADYCNAPYAVGVSSCTTGLFLALKSLGIGYGDDVLVPSLTFIASVNVIRHAGATPVFVDVDPDTWNICSEDLKRKITNKTKAVIVVDQLGLPCDFDALNKIAKQNNLKVVHDAACSFGSKYKGKPVGSYSDVSVFSLHARKIITTAEGGMIVLHSEELEKKFKRLRHQGMSIFDFERHNQPPTVFESYPEIGYNFRITDVQAALGISQMEKINDIIRLRADIANRYIKFLSKNKFIKLPFVPDYAKPNWQSFQIELLDDAPLTRNDLMDKLYARGIPTRRGVMASHAEKPYVNINNSLPVTNLVSQRSLQLPIYPDLKYEQQMYVIEELMKILA